MDRVPGNKLVIRDGKCWSHKGKYLGSYTRFGLTGNPHDPDPEYTFDEGVVSGLGMMFTEVECKGPTKENKNRNKNSIGKSRKTRKSRRNRTNRTNRKNRR